MHLNQSNQNSSRLILCIYSEFLHYDDLSHVTVVQLSPGSRKMSIFMVNTRISGKMIYDAGLISKLSTVDSVYSSLDVMKTINRENLLQMKIIPAMKITAVHRIIKIDIKLFRATYV